MCVFDIGVYIYMYTLTWVWAFLPCCLLPDFGSWQAAAYAAGTDAVGFGKCAGIAPRSS